MPSKKSEDELSLEKCRELLEADGIPYTDEDVVRTRDFLNLIAEIAVDNIFREAKEDNIPKPQ